MYGPPPTPLFTAGAVGFVLTLDPLCGQAGNISTLTGSTLTLIVENEQIATRKVLSGVTPIDGGLKAQYVTTGTDFNSPGYWDVQLVPDYQPGIAQKSPSLVARIFVGPAL
jgi:hypothetical protein